MILADIKQIYIKPTKIIVETCNSRIKLPPENLVVQKNRIVGIRFFARDIYVPISLLIQDNVKIVIDPRLPYHI